MKLETLPTRVRLLKWGVNPTTEGDVIVNERTLAGFAAWQHKVGREEAALDFEHNTVEGTPEYVRSQEPRPVAAFGQPVVIAGDGLYLENLSWTETGTANHQHYTDLSAAPWLDADRVVVGLHSGALCRAGAAYGVRKFTVDGKPAGATLVCFSVGPLPCRGRREEAAPAAPTPPNVGAYSGADATLHTLKDGFVTIDGHVVFVGEENDETDGGERDAAPLPKFAKMDDKFHEHFTKQARNAAESAAKQRYHVWENTNWDAGVDYKKDHPNRFAVWDKASKSFAGKKSSLSHEAAQKLKASAVKAHGTRGESKMKEALSMAQWGENSPGYAHPQGIAGLTKDFHSKVRAIGALHSFTPSPLETENLKLETLSPLAAPAAPTPPNVGAYSGAPSGPSSILHPPSSPSPHPLSAPVGAGVPNQKPKMSDPITPEVLSAQIAAALKPFADRLAAIEAQPKPDLAALSARLDKMDAHALNEQRARIVPLFASEGKVPQNPVTGKAYTADELAALDLPTLRVLHANTPATVPLSARAGSPVERKDSELKGLARVAAAINAQIKAVN